MHKDLLEFSSTSKRLKGRLVLWDSSQVPSFNETAAVSKMFREQYGDNYHAYVLERPDIVRRMIEHGEWVGFVVVDEEGQLLAHAGLLPNGPRCYKFARTIVRPLAQGVGIHSFLTRIRLTFLEELAAAEKVSVSATDAVTAHAGTQRVFENRGFFPVGVYFGKLSDYFGVGRRESVVRYQFLFDPVVRRERTLFAPKIYWPLVESIAERSGCNRRFQESRRPADTQRESLFQLDTQDFATMQSLYYSLDAEASCLPLFNNLEQQKLREVKFASVAVPLCHAAACEQIRLLRSQGFIFGGVEFLPYGDVLVMQWTPDFREGDIDGWGQLEPEAEHLVSMIREVESLPL